MKKKSIGNFLKKLTSLMLSVNFIFSFSAVTSFAEGGKDDIQEQQEYSVLLPSCGENGSIYVSPERELYKAGEKVVISAEPSTGYEFDGWSTDINLPSGVEIKLNTLSITVTENTDLSAITANFVSEEQGNGWNILKSGALIDKTAPYCGDYLMLYRPAYNDGAESSESGNNEDHTEVKSASENSEQAITMHTSKHAANGLICAELRDILIEDNDSRRGFSMPSKSLSEQGEAEAQDELYIGYEKIFKTYDLSYNPSTGGRKYSWDDTEFILKGIGEHVYVWFEKDNPAQITDLQFNQMVESFDSSYQFINDNFTPIYDKNQNGKLDILIYDIKDSSDYYGVYYSGFFSANDLYASIANKADIIHLDTSPSLGSVNTPDISQLVRTMAHETQHLACCSWYQNFPKKGEKFPPVWIDEGLSMAVEHELFGAVESRIRDFNSIRGGFPLNSWSDSDSIKSYALSYVFFQYLKAQDGGISNFYKFYADYDTVQDSIKHDNEASVVADILSQIDAFSGMTANEIIESFYIATLLKEPEGIYGFGGERAFYSLAPYTQTNMPSYVPNGGAVFVSLDGTESTPEQALEQTAYTALTPAKHDVTIKSTDNGQVNYSPIKRAYNNGDIVNITAEADENAVFVGWSGNIAPSDKYKDTLEIECLDDISIKANFASSDELEAIAVRIFNISAENISYNFSNGKLSFLTSDDLFSIERADNKSFAEPISDGDIIKIGIESAEIFTNWVVFIKDNDNIESEHPLCKMPDDMSNNPIEIAFCENYSYIAPRFLQTPQASPSYTSITINNADFFAEYACGTEPDMPEENLEWTRGNQSGKLTFSGLSRETEYYLYARRQKKNTLDQSEYIMNNTPVKTLKQSSGGVHFSNGGSTNSSKPTEPNPPDKTQECAFADIKSYWAEKEISKLAEHGIIDGYPDNEFKPERQTTRAEAVVMLSRMIGLEINKNIINDRERYPFNDSYNHWARDYIRAFFEKGYIKGASESQFNPDSEITREQLAVMICRIVDFHEESATADFTDSADISEWAVSAVNALYSSEIIIGCDDNSFRPQKSVTRAQAAVIINRTLDYISLNNSSEKNN